jgi:hypothetical protein
MFDPFDEIFAAWFAVTELLIVVPADQVIPSEDEYAVCVLAADSITVQYHVVANVS